MVLEPLWTRGATPLLGAVYRALRPAVFALDPEHAHDLTLAALRSVERTLLLTRVAPRPPAPPALETTVFGLRFPNPVGLAAGLDKHGEAPHVWPLLGFGFAELGTVTARPQPGNPRPRIFRFPEQRAVVNRMGFNSVGAEAVARALAEKLTALPSTVPLGVNIGKSRATPLKEAAEDYAQSFRLLVPWADYVCINVSSPNTPGLRELQRAAHLERILTTLQAENRSWAQRTHCQPRPILVKVAPELDEAELREMVAVATNAGVAGFVATNTTTDRTALPEAAGIEGGLSGAPLEQRSTEVVRCLFRITGGKIPIVGVGGICNGGDAYEKIRAGASLVQLYTGLIYEGPDLPRRICQDLVHRLEADGVEHIREVVGADA